MGICQETITLFRCNQQMDPNSFGTEFVFIFRWRKNGLCFGEEGLNDFDLIEIDAFEVFDTVIEQIGVIGTEIDLSAFFQPAIILL